MTNEHDKAAALADLKPFLDAKTPPFSDGAKAIWAHAETLRALLQPVQQLEHRAPYVSKLSDADLAAIAKAEVPGEYDYLNELLEDAVTRKDTGSKDRAVTTSSTSTEVDEAIEYIKQSVISADHLLHIHLETIIQAAKECERLRTFMRTAKDDAKTGQPEASYYELFIENEELRAQIDKLRKSLPNDYIAQKKELDKLRQPLDCYGPENGKGKIG